MVLEKNMFKGKGYLIDGKYLATDIFCRWVSVAIGDTSTLNIGWKAYEHMLKKGKYIPLIFHFGNSYVLLKFELNDKVLNLNIESPYKDGNVPKNELGLVSYVAIELIKREYYRNDSIMRKYERYYDEIRKRIPEKYVIKVNGDAVYFSGDTMGDIYYNLKENSGNSYDKFEFEECKRCPLRGICSSAPTDYNVFDNRSTIMDFYESLKNAGIDGLFLVTHYILKYFPMMDNSYFNLEFFMEYSPEKYNYAVKIKPLFPNENFLLSLKDGKFYSDAIELITHNPGIRIFDNAVGDVTDFLFVQKILLDSLLHSKNVENLEEFFKDYPENERYLAYLSVIEIENDDFSEDNIRYVNGKYGTIDILWNVYNSKLFQDGYLRVELDDDYNIRIYPTFKFVKVLTSKLKEVVE